MGKLHVWEETGKTRVAVRSEWFLFPEGVPSLCTTEQTHGVYPILRRLTDEEVEGLLISQEILKTHSRTVGAIWWDDIAMKWQSAPQPADDERARFVRETAARMLPAVWARVAELPNSGEWRDHCAAEESVKAAESLAARVFGEKTK